MYSPQTFDTAPVLRLHGWIIREKCIVSGGILRWLSYVLLFPELPYKVSSSSCNKVQQHRVMFLLLEAHERPSWRLVTQAPSAQHVGTLQTPRERIAFSINRIFTQSRQGESFNFGLGTKFPDANQRPILFF